MKTRLPIPLCLLLLFLAWSSALALNPNLQISQYAHTAWYSRDGGFRGNILSITQTPDGYLWLGTSFGLVRFDGVRFVEWKPQSGSPLPKPPYWRVHASRDGSLWIGSSNGLARVKNGKVTNYPKIDAESALAEDSEGTVWVGGGNRVHAQLCGIHDDKVQCFGGDDTFGKWIRSIYADPAGNLWVGTIKGVWRWKPGVPKFYPGAGAASGLTADEHGTILIAALQELRALIDGKEQAYPTKIPGGPISTHALLTDKGGGVWVGTEDRGLVHIYRGRVDAYKREDGLSGNAPSAFFEDREGNIWVGTNGGLDRFRELAIPSMTSKQFTGLDGIGAVLATRDGSLWMSSGTGLSRIRGDKADRYSKENGLPDSYVSSLFEDQQGRLLISTPKGAVWWQNGKFVRTNIPGDEAFSITEDSSGHYWICDYGVGLIHMAPDGKILEVTPWNRFKTGDILSGVGRSVVGDPVRGGIWMGGGRRSLFYLKDGKVLEQYGPSQGFEGPVRDIQLEPDGTVWASTEGGLSRLKDGKVAFLSSKNGLPCDNVFWKKEDDEGTVWLRTACGLVRFAKSEMTAWSNDPLRKIKIIRVLDHTDGVEERSQPGFYTPQVAKASDGRLYFPEEGLAIIDPRWLPFNTLKPPTVIEQISADGKDYDVSSPVVSIAPRPRDLRIDYTALSLVNPGKVRFRYKLENHDAGWQDPGTRRQAFYSDLHPGRYRFHVIACNNDGVWNEEGAALDFRVEPAWYQTNLFLALCVAASIGLIWMCVRLRIRFVAAGISQRAEIRADERVRIARDLHDTLLQGVQALTLRFHVVSQNLPADSRDREAMEAALTSADRIVLEARNRVSHLRTGYFHDKDLCRSFEEIASELDYEKRVRFSCAVGGSTEGVTLSVLQELYYIGREAVINAFRHAQASEIKVTLQRLPKELVLTITDNGCGFEPDHQLKNPGVGHWGFRGMNERSEAVGASFECASSSDQGTSVVVRVPSARAYENRR